MAEKTLGALYREIIQLGLDARARAAACEKGSQAYVEHVSEAAAYEHSASIVRAEIH